MTMRPEQAAAETGVERASRLLAEKDNITILCHTRPDGDTLGSAFALLFALRALGKTCRVLSPDGYPDKYEFLYGKYSPMALRGDLPEYVVSVDVADVELLAQLRPEYEGRIDLCIDHHGSNRRIGRENCIDPASAAAGELVYLIIGKLGVALDAPMADCLYTAVSTDTGVFRYSNTTSRTLRIAADLLDMGVDAARINNAMYASKSRRRIAAEAILLQNIRYDFNGRCAMIFITRELREKTGVDDFDLDDIPTLPRSIEGVQVGVTLREEQDDCRVSVRTGEQADASAICAPFGGGGHIRAAGCHIPGTLEQARESILKVIGDCLA